MHEDDFIDINLEEVEDIREAVPSGIYESRIKSIEKKQKSEYPYLDVRLQPLKDGLTRKTLFLSLSFSPDALWNLKQFARACGVEFGSRGFNYKDFLDKHVAVTVTKDRNPDQPDETETDAWRNNVKPPYHKLAR